MKINFKNFFAIITLGLILFFSLVGVASAAVLQKDGKDVNTGFVYVCDPPGQCDFKDLMAAVEKVVNFAVKFALGFSVVVIAIAGWKYLNSGGSSGERDKANKMFVSVGWGILFVLSAWLIVNLIMKTLVGGEFNILKN